MLAESSTHSTANKTAQAASDLGLHWLGLLLSVAILSASLILQVRGGRQVVVPWVEIPLPGTCVYYQLFGAACPGCGLTRSFVSLAHGQFGRAWTFNPAGILLFGFVVLQIPYRLWQIRRLQKGREALQLGRHAGWTLALLGGLLVLQWLLRLFGPANLI